MVVDLNSHALMGSSSCISFQNIESAAYELRVNEGRVSSLSQMQMNLKINTLFRKQEGNMDYIYVWRQMIS